MIGSSGLGPRQGVQMISDRRAGVRRRGLLAVLLLTTVIAASMLATACGGGSRAPALGKPPAPHKPIALGPNEAEVTISVQAPTQAIPKLFLGLSTEFTTLPLAERYPIQYERV